MLALVHVVQTRFYTPPGVVQRLIQQRDPVITCGGGMLRLEGFSACCGVYARVDLLGNAFEADRLEPGTSNVDFNPPMRAALARLGDGERARLAVSKSGFELVAESGQAFERRVELPVRWIKGFVEVQAHQARMERRFAISGPMAHRFLRDLPRQRTAGAVHILPMGNTLRLSQTSTAASAPVGGVDRVRILSEVARHATELEVYSSGDGATAWRLETPDARLFLVLSPEPSRGFSGEGQVLGALAEGSTITARVRALLRWQNSIDARAMAAELGASESHVASALAELGTAGLTGYDLASGTYFHRELPFDLSRVDSFHPRLADARELVRTEQVELEVNGDAWVRGRNAEYRVRRDAEGARHCTCPWAAKHGTSRGPCKHILAVQITAGGEELTMSRELLAAIDAGDQKACIRLLRGLDETARRALQPAIAAKLEEIEAAPEGDTERSRLKLHRSFTAARTAMLGTASLGELKKAAPLQFDGEAAPAILADRRPAWLAEWSEFELTRNWWNWKAVRPLVRDGVIPKPATEFYILGMISTGSPRQLLTQDPALLGDELWRLFEHEGTGELSLAARDKYAPPSKTWLEGLRGMAADGMIDRDRLLRSTLEALLRDFAPFRAGWFSRLHEALKPSRPERAKYRELYLDQLNSRVPATVSFAMKALVELDKGGALQAEVVLERLGPALEARDKGTVERALSVLSRVAARDESPQLKTRIAVVAARALGNESLNVQASALALVGSNSALVEPYVSVLAPSVRARIQTTGPAATNNAPLSVPAATRVLPVRDAAELAELFAAVLENQGPPVDIERVVDGAARISATARLTASLAKRAEKLLERPGQEQPRSALAELALAWTSARRTPEPELRREQRAPWQNGEDDLSDFLVWRLWCVAEQVALGQQRLLLSLPTWPDGRIDPQELERRLQALPRRERQAAESDRASLFHLDFLLAKLRAGAPPELSRFQARLTWKKRTWELDGKTYSHHEAFLEIVGVSAKDNNFDPALLCNRREWRDYGTRGKGGRFDPALLSIAHFRASLEMRRWCATVSPVWREGWFAAGCRDVGHNLDWWTADWSARAYLEPLVEPHTAISAVGGLLLALGLGAKEAAEHTLAVDALIAALGDGRLDSAGLGRALIEAASSGAMKFARWGKQLARAAAPGPVQGQAIFLALEMLFESGAGKEAADYSKLVELARELAHQTGLRLSKPGAIATLEAIPTGGKTKRVVTDLLALRQG